MTTPNRQIQLAGIPTDKLRPEHFSLAQAAMPQAAEGEVLLRIRLISLDAANRAWMQGATYRSALQAGQAPQPWAASTFSAIAICCSRVARSAVGAYAPPPKFSQVVLENCRPP